MNENGKRSEDKLSFLKNKKNALLNKFLTKTFHMIEQCDTSVACWATDGKSFLIRDVDFFAKNVLPLYFKHSKFASFVRQLNFYSFRKLRAETDDENPEWPPPLSRNSSKSTAVRFAHEHFRRGQPELLHKITRVTKSQEPTSSEMKSLKDDIFELKKDIVTMSNQFDQRLQAMSAAMEADYQRRMSSLALSYQAISTLTKQLQASQGVHPQASEVVRKNEETPHVATPTSAAKPTNSVQQPTIPTPEISESSKSTASSSSSNTEEGAESPAPRGKLLSPLLTLSGIATAMMNDA